MELDPNYDYLIEDGKVICKTKKITVRGITVDPNDFSFRVKSKYDKIDKEKMERLKHNGYLGNEKQKQERAKYGSMNLQRWGFKG